MRRSVFFVFLFVMNQLNAQAPVDAWIASQLGTIVWHQTYEGVLADYHPVTITLASDKNMIAGYLIHKGDMRQHRLMGDWNKKNIFQLQERDEYDRLTGYLNGSITGDQVHMEWMSADQSRMFNITAYPKDLIKIINFKPVAEWITVGSDQNLSIAVQKMDYGIVSGIAKRKEVYTRFEGYCLDGNCSIWNTVLQTGKGAPIRVQMRQRNAETYQVLLDGKDYPGTIRSAIPLAVRQFDNSMGFLDFVYPSLDSKSYKQWLGNWIDKTWQEGVSHLKSINQPGTSGRLVHRSSGWVEILAENENYISGLITYMNPGSNKRESFIWLKKEDIFLPTSELLNSVQDMKSLSDMAVKICGDQGDEEYLQWLRGTGFLYMIPSPEGLVMVTDFNMIFGDDIRKLPLHDSISFVKKKYWKLFGW